MTTFHRERADEWLERGILGLVLVALVYGPLATGAVLAYDFLVLQGLAACAVVLWVVRLWLGNQKRLLWPPVSWGVLAFAGYALARHYQADIEYVSRAETLKVLIYAFFFFVILQNLNRQSHSQITAIVLVFLAMFISLYAIYQFATDSPYVWHYIKPAAYAKRASGTYICPNHLAGFLEMILPLGLALTCLGKLSHVSRVFLAYASMVILAGIVTTVSRGGWISCGLTLAVFIVVLLRNRKYWLPAAILLVLLGGVGAFIYSKGEAYQNRLVRISEKKVETRTLLWEPAFQMWQDHPWFGVGPAHFDDRFREYRKIDFYMRPGRVHNDYLNTLADWGLTGAVLVASTLGLFFFGSFKSWKYVQRTSDFPTKQSNKPAILLGMAAGLFALLVHSFFDFNFHIPANAILAVSLIAFASQSMRYTSDRYWVPAGFWLRLSLTLVCAAGVFYMGKQGWTRFHEERLLNQASAKPNFSVPRIEILKEAFSVEPHNAATAQQIGEACRRQSWQGNDDYKTWALEAVRWFNIAIKLNPYDPISRLRCGMSLDWLKRFDEAEPCFAAAARLDPNGYYVTAHLGWHRVQLGDYAGAIPLLERSWKIRPGDNPIAESYLRIARERVALAPQSPIQK
jgi:O-antigen ligase